MRKVLALLLVLVVLMIPIVANADIKYEKSPLAAMWLSMILPGTGEWYNSGWQGSYPWGECVIGNICCFFQVSSIFDAVSGRTDGDMRLDFWTSPSK